MKAKQRKRLLISSVAMLLVAMLALGTATFAWFTQNSKATASGITAKTTQASNILVSEDQSVWDDEITFQNNIVSVMNPVTTADFSAWYTTKAESYDGAVPAADAVYETAAAGTDFTATTLYVKYESADSQASQGVNITAKKTGNGQTDNFLRIALVPKNDAAKTLFGSSAVVWGTAADDYATDKEHMTTNVGSGKSLVTTNNLSFYTSKTLTANTEYGFDVYVWYEGTDPHCKDSVADNNYSVAFEVTKAS